MRILKEFIFMYILNWCIENKDGDLLLDADLKRARWPLRSVEWRSVVFPSALIGGASSPAGDVGMDAARCPHGARSPRARAVGRWPPSAAVLGALCRHVQRVSGGDQGRSLQEGRGDDVPKHTEIRELDLQRRESQHRSGAGSVT